MINNNHITTFDSLLSFITEEDDDMSDLFDAMADIASFDKPIYHAFDGPKFDIELYDVDRVMRLFEMLQDPDQEETIDVVGGNTHVQSYLDFIYHLKNGKILALDGPHPLPSSVSFFCCDKEKFRKFLISQIEEHDLWTSDVDENNYDESMGKIYDSIVQYINKGLDKLP